MTAPGAKLELRRTYIQTLSAIYRSGGYRLAKQLDKLVPLIIEQCKPGDGANDPEKQRHSDEISMGAGHYRPLFGFPRRRRSCAECANQRLARFKSTRLTGFSLVFLPRARKSI